MKDILLGCMVAAVLAFGFFVVKKLDAFLEENRARANAKTGAERLSLGVDDPMVVGALTPLINEFSCAQPGCRIEVFCGTGEELSGAVASGDVDIGFFAGEAGETGAAGCDSARIMLERAELPAAGSRPELRPLVPGNTGVSAVWRSERGGELADILALILDKAENKYVRRMENAEKM